VHEVLQLVFRLVGHPTTSVFPLVAAAAFAASLVLVLGALQLPAGPRRLFRSLLLTLVVGLAVSVAANFVVVGFTAAKVSYSTWALPLVSLLLAAALAKSRGPWAGLTMVAALAYCFCEGAGIGQLAGRGEHFAHGPHRRIQRILDQLPREATAVIHADPLEEFSSIYFPLRFADGPTLRQFTYAEPGALPPLGTPLDLTSAGWAQQLAPYRYLVVVRSKAQTARALGDQLRHGDRPLDDSRLLSALTVSPQWTPREHDLFVSFVAADVTVFEHRDAAAP
jgi:hypothetical protein